MSCAHLPSVQALIDDEVPEGARHDIQQHVDGCDGCQRAFRDGVALRRTFQAGLRRLVPVRDLEALTDRVLERERDSQRLQRAKASAPGDETPPDIPGFRITGVLGTGGMGTVYRAYQESMRREVALKVLGETWQSRTAYVQRFLREARAAAALNHPHVVRTFDAGDHDGRSYHVMELVEGESLRVRLGRGPLSPQNALAVAKGVASALIHAGEHGLIHRDIKPDNILLERASGRAKLADLGLARFEDDQGGTLTVAGQVMGTPNYMSPEQARDTHRVDARSDIYSLGATLFHAVTGRTPFRANGAVEVLSRVLSERLQLPAGLELPPGLASVLLRMTEPDPARRYQNAVELLGDLDAVEAGTPPPVASGTLGPVATGSSARVSAAPRPRRVASARPSAPPLHRSPAVIVLGMALVSIVAMLGVWAARQTPEARGTRPVAKGPAGPQPEADDATSEAADAQGATRRRRAVHPALIALAARQGAELAGSLVSEAPEDERAVQARELAARFEADLAEARRELAGGRYALARQAAGRVLRYGDDVMRAAAGAVLAEVDRVEGAARAREMRLAAREAYRPIRYRYLVLLGELDIRQAERVMHETQGDARFAAIPGVLALDAEDLARATRVLEGMKQGLAGQVGRPVMVPQRDGATLHGTLDRNVDTYFVVQSGRSIALSPRRVTPKAILGLAGEAGAVPAGDRAAFLVAAGDDEAEGAIRDWEAAGGPPAEVAAAREKLALVVEMNAIARLEEEARKAEALLEKGDEAWGRAEDAKDPKRPLKDAKKHYGAAVEQYAHTPPVAQRREQIDARLAEIEALLEGGGKETNPLARIFAGKVRVLPTGQIEVTYDFSGRGVERLLEDFSKAGMSNGALRRGLDAFQGTNPRPPAPYAGVTAWSAIDGGVLGWGWDRLVWKGKLKGDMQVKVRATALMDRNLLVTLCDDGADHYYLLGLGFALPELPSWSRTRFPELASSFDPWRVPQDATLECVRFPDLRDKGKRPSTLVAGRPVAMTAERKTSGPKVLLEVSSTGRPLEGEDTLEPLAGGRIGIAAWASAIVFHSVQVVGTLDEAWLAEQLKKLEEEDRAKAEKDKG